MSPTPRSERWSALWICGLLLIRMSLVIPALYSSELYTWVAVPTLTYLITLYLLFRNRGNLAKYRIDKLSYLIIQFAGPFMFVFCFKVQEKTVAAIAGTVTTIATIAFSVLAFRNKLVPSGSIRKHLVWLPVGILSGLVIAALLNVGAILHVQPRAPVGRFSLNSSVSSPLSPYSCSRGSVGGALFRAFCLRTAAAESEHATAVVVQAALFTLAHLYFYPRLEFYLLVPVCGIVFGLLTVASKGYHAACLPTRR